MRGGEQSLSQLTALGEVGFAGGDEIRRFSHHLRINELCQGSSLLNLRGCVLGIEHVQRGDAALQEIGTERLRRTMTTQQGHLMGVRCMMRSSVTTIVWFLVPVPPTPRREGAGSPIRRGLSFFYSW